MYKIVRSKSVIPCSIGKDEISRPRQRHLGLGATYMTEYLIAARAAIILWTNLAVMPTGILFDAIEAELERRGLKL